MTEKMRDPNEPVTEALQKMVARRETARDNRILRSTDSVYRVSVALTSEVNELTERVAQNMGYKLQGYELENLGDSVRRLKGALSAIELVLAVLRQGNPGKEG